MVVPMTEDWSDMDDSGYSRTRPNHTHTHTCVCVCVCSDSLYQHTNNTQTHADTHRHTGTGPGTHGRSSRMMQQQQLQYQRVIPHQIELLCTSTTEALSLVNILRDAHNIHTFNSGRRISLTERPLSKRTEEELATRGRHCSTPPPASSLSHDVDLTWLDT